MYNKKICVVGSGYWGKNHIRTFHELGTLGGIVESNAKVLDSLAQKYPYAKTYIKVEEATVVHVLDPPEAPLKRSKPQKKRIVIMAGFFGIGLGVGLVFVREYWKNSSEN